MVKKEAKKAERPPRSFRTCKLCGNRFMPTSNSQIFCSVRCRIANEKQTAADAEAAKRSAAALRRAGAGKTLAELNAEARANGMTYGKYVAYLACKEGGGKSDKGSASQIPKH